MVSLEARVDALTQEVMDEIELLKAQLAKSSAARVASAAVPSEGKEDIHLEKPADQTSSSATASAPSVTASPLASSSTFPTNARGSSQPSPSPSSTPVGHASSPVVVSPLAATHKEGTLLHLVRSGGLFGAGGSQQFVPHYLVVSGNTGISWYASKADFQSQPQRPLGHAAFWVETYNSRGSRFKKAAVCWPLILMEDCAAASDPDKTYFAVDYYTSNGGRDRLVLAADSPEERDAWVQLLTKYIDLYLAPRAESEELQHITRGAAVPMHRSGVIAGEAPGGTIL